MFKLVTLFALVACAVAAPAPGFLAAPAAYHVAEPAVAVAHSVHSLPVATSYSNTYKVDKSAYIAQPAYAYHAAPVAVAHAPVAVHQAAAYSVHPASYQYAHAAPVATYYH